MKSSGKLQNGSESELIDVSQLRREYEDGLRQNQELRVELVKLRLENQTLYIELERVADLRYLIYKTVQTGWRNTRRRVSYIRSRIQKHITGKSRYDDNYNKNFQPYQVRLWHPPEADRPRILHVIGNFYTGGSARLVVDLIEHLGHKFDQEIITRDKPDRPEYVGLKIHQYKRFANRSQVLSSLKKFGPDIIHIHYLGHHHNSYSELDWK